MTHPNVVKRVETWKDRLLDLSLRNKQVNFVFNQSVIQLKPFDFVDTLTSIFDDKTLSILQATEDLPQEVLSQGLTDVEQDEDQNPIERKLRRKLKKALLTEQTPDRIAKTYLKLYRESERLELERGSRSLYLSVGFIKWFEADASEIERFCPIALIPIKLQSSIQKKSSYQVNLSSDDDQVCFNESMIRKFEVEFGIKIPNCLSQDPPELDPQELTSEQEPEERTLVEQLTDYFNQIVLLIDQHKLHRWEVIRDQWAISILDFTKGVMWRDLSSLRDDQLSGVVSQLLSGGEGKPPACNITPLEHLDDPPSATHQSLYPLLPFDPSQQQAILSAIDGGTFVLQGPPGTGKSQTITQMIAQLIAKGKKVLFVSEKRAALDVVARRLTQLKLGPFFLNAHSHKSTKRQLIDDLWKPMLLREELIESGQWSTEARAVTRRRFTQAIRKHQGHKESLNKYTTLMSQKTRWEGHSNTPQTQLELLERLVELSELLREPQFSNCANTLLNHLRSETNSSDLLSHSDIDLGVITSKYAEIEKVMPLLSVCRHEHWSPSWNQSLESKIRSLLDALQVTQSIFEEHSLPLPTREMLSPVRRIVELLIVLDPSSQLYKQAVHGQLNTEECLELCETVSTFQKLKRSLTQRWKPELWMHPDLNLIRGAFIKWAEAWKPLRFLFLFGKRRTLLKLKLEQTELSDLELRDDLVSLAFQDEYKDKIKQLTTFASATLGLLWRGEDSDINLIKQRVHQAEEVGNLYENSKGDTQLNQLFSRLEDLRSNGQNHILSDLLDRISNLLSHFDDLLEHGQFVFSTQYANKPLSFWSKWGEALNSQKGNIQRVCSLNQDLAKLDTLGWRALVQMIRSAQLPSGQLNNLVKYVTFQQTWSAFCEAQPQISSFSATMREDQIKSFELLDQELSSISQDEVRRCLLEPLPELTEISSRRTTRQLVTTEDRIGAGLSTLKREFEKKTRHKPLRALFQSCAEAITTLKPCVCMSPLSVAHYLPLPEVGEALFDVVIFDEASQLRPWDAIGAIARAKQAVIVGDSKQLPPTNFFQSSSLDEFMAEDDEEEMIEDLESILDEAVASRFKELTLRWHYRSRHESLIAFSNYMYYQNRLHTFPSAELSHDDLGVRLIHIEGNYERGKSRTNRIEADQVVQELFRILLKDPSTTVGIVTFSQPQQILIDDLVDHERQKHPELEDRFSGGHPEPVFIKNLETVQGDERDVILFSIGYGPDNSGRIFYNFGALNKVGGERRLNVAVTRARKALLVFSTLTGDMLDTRKLNATGALHLKKFLDYAAQGISALHSNQTLNGDAQTESPFEDQVLKFLQSKGWEVVPQVGVAGYRIDLGVVDPKHPGRFILGVECDGATYHSSKVARERDILRQKVLEGLGWTIHRIWSTDWWIDPKPQQVKLHEHLLRLTTS